MFVIAGVTGHTGKAAAEALLAQHQPVRVLVRDEAKGAPWRARGAEVAVASLTDVAALTLALSDAEGAYLLVPPQYGSADMLGDQARVVTTIASAVKASGIPHVVALSSLGAAHAAGTGPIRTLHRFERALEHAAPNLTLLRAAYFAENNAAALGDVQAKGRFPTFLTPGRAIPMVASLDVGRTAAALLLEPAHGVRVVDLLGPVDLAPEDVARECAGLIGRPVAVAFAPLEAVEPALKAAGMTPNVAALFREMIAAINSGLVDVSGGSATTRRATVPIGDVLGALLQATAA